MLSRDIEPDPKPWESSPMDKNVAVEQGSIKNPSDGEQTGSDQEESKEDENLVTWDGPDDPANPLNWARSKKWICTWIIATFAFISPLSSTMLAPALPTIAKEFKISSSMEEALVMSIFLLAYAIGPFLLGPLSEIYGRVVVLQTANMVYLIFNTLCGISRSKQQILAFRFLSGLGGSAPQTLNGGMLSDCWRAEERGKAIAIYSFAPFIGPVVGPIAAGYIAQNTSWRWIFWATSIFDAVVQILAFIFLSETYAPKILATKAKKLRRETGNEKLRTKWETPDRSLFQILRKNLSRPFIMLFTQPAIQVLGLYRAYLYGLMYLVLATFPLVWEQAYKFSLGIASLHYISLGIGFVIGLQICAPLNDRAYCALKKRYSHPGRPEFRIPLMIPAGLLVPIGIFLYGWSTHYRTHWIIPDIGCAIFAMGLIIGFQCVQSYVVDSYPRYAASATGAVAFLRTMAGFGFPLFGSQLYETLGLGWGNSLLGFISLTLGIFAPWGLWHYGEKLRAISGYCSG
ncbi:Major Facilitator Superfamily protein [Coccidioides posadasii C735 delta SOWgp]|uniref:Benomyl/methotrexate resistance protein n=2 Tax=Coccidioides posadasii TaxID=199306 RepID=A0A0J6F9S1_COCPO|nr:Major Facilitator Superfamily protein [Coccidioides posadasii C735 delta SOWgp]EER24330.1 Major Facilitator Superfamily protein [Coccidioides posadasii C735 delta SOWgp]KMM66010.1 benomyl/methotrexate resistance protein [Coccidioides posadasii RMSCC 3488]|eukprot:XP_003066475.1 Major Facilitator Superfamily protein [Coccidioides posadasii C735 delta SOWgp]